MNARHDLPVKNIIYEYKEEFYCVLTQRQIMKFSIEHFDIVEDKTWFAHFSPGVNSYYAHTNTGGIKTTGFHGLVCRDLVLGETPDHINHVTLDNTTQNIRSASITTQAINRRISTRNTSSVVGVCYSNTRCWCAYWIEAHKLCIENFYVSVHGDRAYDLAVAFRKEKENTIPEYKIALCK